MDNLQCTFKESYASHLKDEVKANISLDKYGQNEFDYDRTKVKQIANLYEPKQLLEKLLVTNNDFDAAVILYEAYKNLSPLLASTEAFWVYLTHVDLFKYVQYRHPVEKAKNIQSHILDHWFFGKGYIRNTLASLWWSVYCSVDVERDNPYELTEIFFKNYSFRVIFLKIMLRTKEGLLGILEFLKENPDVLNNNFENRGRFIAKYFNGLGGYKQLSYLKRDYFKNELYKIKDIILKITDRDDIQNRDISSILDSFE
jgi:hypothetical protein